MSRYVLIASRDPFESRDVPHVYRLAGGLASAGHHVTLFLVQNGVLAVRKGARLRPLDGIAEKVEILADDFSLRERGIEEGERLERVRPAGIDLLVERMTREAGTKVLWH